MNAVYSVFYKKSQATEGLFTVECLRNVEQETQLSSFDIHIIDLYFFLDNFT